MKRSAVSVATAGVPDASGQLRGVCIYADGTWEATSNNNNGGLICEWTGVIIR